MRVRILKLSSGIMDGVSLSHLFTGITYEVPVSLGTWLISERHAEEDVTPPVGIVIPIDQTSPMFTGGVSVSPGEEQAADRPLHRKRASKKR
jgi:hypothetical protein